MWTEITNQISQVTGQAFEINHRRSVGGGCINQSYALIGDTCTYFVKLSQASQVQMFEAEALGLKQMFATKTILVPKPICLGTAADSAYIVLEWLELGGSKNTQVSEEMGRQLAAMHRAKLPQEAEGKFGWNQNNTIGSTPQINTWNSNWAEFFTEHRLGYQFQLARRHGGHFSQQDKLLTLAPKLLDHQPQPSLVHGDLWGGNAAVTTSGEPVILDPATYVGDREVDLAMTELFGGFPAAFYRGYNEAWPLDEGYQRRKTLYNLYHILNHFNLFGGGYSSQANRMIDQILS
ncbi:fructosamine kinase family protein [Lyngbya aestuarii]|uniref:fructosamine kinase family protein n=1 Tax=Lyngbya aestuarii TaxID=118322 RepID=UPI00403DCD32